MFVCFQLIASKSAYFLDVWTSTTHRSSSLTNNHPFSVTELFRMVQELHSSGNFNDWQLNTEI